MEFLLLIETEVEIEDTSSKQLSSRPSKKAKSSSPTRKLSSSKDSPVLQLTENYKTEYKYELFKNTLS